MKFVVPSNSRQSVHPCLHEYPFLWNTLDLQVLHYDWIPHVLFGCKEKRHYIPASLKRCEVRSSTIGLEESRLSLGDDFELEVEQIHSPQNGQRVGNHHRPNHRFSVKHLSNQVPG